MKISRAIIDWIPKHFGGRTAPPSGSGSPPYATLIRFVDDQESWPPEVAWSLVVTKIEGESTAYSWIADVHFLAPEAPHDLLRKGRSFELFEGKKCVARGHVIN